MAYTTLFTEDSIEFEEELWKVKTVKRDVFLTSHPYRVLMRNFGKNSYTLSDEYSAYDEAQAVHVAAVRRLLQGRRPTVMSLTAFTRG